MLAMPRWPLSVTDEAEDQGVHSKGGSCLTHAQEGALSGCLSASFLQQSGSGEMRCKGRKTPGLNKRGERGPLKGLEGLRRGPLAVVNEGEGEQSKTL